MMSGMCKIAKGSARVYHHACSPRRGGDGSVDQEFNQTMAEHSGIREEDTRSEPELSSPQPYFFSARSTESGMFGHSYTAIILYGMVPNSTNFNYTG
jgi:hypothetical protein